MVLAHLIHRTTRILCPYVRSCWSRALACLWYTSIPRVLLCMLAVLTFGQPEHIGSDLTIIYSSPLSQISSNNTIQVGSATYSIIRQIFFNYLICGRGTTCWHVCQNGEDFVIKDSWTHESQVNREADILSKIHGLKRVPQLVTAWTVQIEGSDDRTDA